MPKCGIECEVYSRVVGYFRPVKSWNRGKQEEFGDRREYRPLAGGNVKARPPVVEVVQRGSEIAQAAD